MPASGAGSDGNTSDSFTFTVTDADGDSVTKTVNVTLQPDSVPTLSVTDVTVDEKGLARGSGEYADHFGMSEDLNSDTSETATGTFTINTGNDSLEALEVQAANGTWVDVTAATMAVPVIVNGTFGTLTVTSDGAGQYSYSYTLTDRLGHSTPGAGETLPGDSFAVRVTDSDNDTTAVTATTTIDVLVKDDAPIVYAKDATIPIANSGAVSGTGNFDFTVGADQRTSYSAMNSDFTTITLTGTVGSQTIASTPLTWLSESATEARFSFSFDYQASGMTVTENGILVFDKVNGSYTVDLQDPIQASVSPPSVSGANSIIGYVQGTTTVSGNNPLVSVATIPLDPTDPNTSNKLFVQFTGFSEQGSGTGANNFRSNSPSDTATPLVFTPGDTLDTNNQDFVSISGSANGVGGDTMGKGEVLNMNFFATDPKGIVTNTDFAQVSTVFFKFDGIGANEDMIIILKLQDANDPSITTTKAFYVANADILKQGGNLGVYSGITLDNNDGVVIIESNDYNVLPTDNWIITGAQITSTDEGITGPAYNLNGAVGTLGGTEAAPSENFSSDVNDVGFKVSDIGFLTRTTTLQNASLKFTFQLKDSEGDLSAVQVLTANVVNQTTPIALDLDGGGIDFTSLAAGTTFDYGDDGSRVATAWVGGGDGLLAIDLNGNGKVDNGTEIVFSQGSLSDLEGLAAKYDKNHDGVLDAGDADFARFGVWQDANANGVADAGEFRTLAELGIVSINLTSDGVAYSAAGGDVSVAGSSTFTRADGSTGALADAAFATAARSAQRTAEIVTTAALAGAAVNALPVAAQVSETDGTQADGLAALQPVAGRSGAQVETVSAADTFRPALADTTDHEAVQPEMAAHRISGETSEARFIANDSAFGDLGDVPAWLGAAGGPQAAQGAGALLQGMGAEGTMQALLSIAPHAAAEAGIANPGLAALDGALSDIAGEALVDSIVEHFAAAGRHAPVELGAIDGAEAGSFMLLQGIGGAGAEFAALINLPEAHDDASMLASAQA
ncbi:beta strand repeat-containing protein, partial [Tsuneonella sp. SYSU-LHT278]|uniref:beta strand repeat-containing protein n=1 Tax=Tsuneonella sediminis TaxID=3416089 RepID=UPI003F79C5F7